MAKPKDINELRDQLLDAFDWVKADPRRANQVKEMTNAADGVRDGDETMREVILYALTGAELWPNAELSDLPKNL